MVFILMKNVLIFGSYGSIGNYIYEKFQLNNFNVYGTTTNKCNSKDNILFVTNDYLNELNNINNLDIIIWATGLNVSDNIDSFDIVKFNEIISANVTFILNTLHFLLHKNKISDNAKMVIISSIWQEFTKNNKLSYSISKGALDNLLKSVCFDLSKKNILINNVLPGVINNEMTNKNLSKENIDKIKNYMYFSRLITLEDVYNTVKFLVTENSGITGQSIIVDLGYTSVRII